MSAADYFVQVHPDDRCACIEALDKMNSGIDRNFSFEIRHRLNSHSEWSYCEYNAAPFARDASGKVVRYTGYRKDTTALRRLNEKLESYAFQYKLIASCMESIALPEVNDSVVGDIINRVWSYLKAKACVVAQYVGGEKPFFKILLAQSLLNDKNNPFVAGNGIIYESEFPESYAFLKSGAPIHFKRGESMESAWKNEMNGLLERFSSSEVMAVPVKFKGNFWGYITVRDADKRFNLAENRIVESLAHMIEIYMERVDNKNKLQENLNMWKDLTSRFSLAMKQGEITPWEFDRNTGIIATVFNDGVIQKTNIRLDSYIGFTHPDDLEKMESAFEILKNGENKSFSVEVRFKNDSMPEWGYAVIASTPYEFDANGKVLRYAGFRHDITRWKNAQRNLEDLNKQVELILHNINSAVLFIDTDYKIRWENLSKGFRHLLYNPSQPMSGICYKDLLGRDVPCENCYLNSSTQRKGTRRVNALRNGLELEIFETAIHSDGESLTGVAIRIDDITKRQRIMRDLEDAKRKAESANALKGAFLANMSHEIRTPLNSIVGFSELISSCVDGDERKKYQSIITSNSELLLKLINDVLDLSKIESGTLSFVDEKFDLSLMIEEIATSTSRMVKEGVVVKTEIPHEHFIVFFDKQRIAQLITNLATNATKFTMKGSITLGYEVNKARLKIYVKDTGIGIAKENQHRIFGRFEKLNTFAQGTGLGLAICKTIVEKKNGRMGVNSIVGEGSEFWAEIPLKGKIENREEAIASDDILRKRMFKEIAGLKILVAEDVKVNFLLLKTVLKGAELTNAVNGREAVDFAMKNRYDAILMDMRMPIMDGGEATKLIREFDKKTPIIALTANAFESDRVEAKNAGCSGFLAKPIKKDEVIEAILCGSNDI